ncbi:hypothetical protein BpHYR1_050908 [Brachionus plicatilis]|uniref:Uncharacterized protein n=1 Tax=Brachionus plicatilis TaxID=10195 RepID=A0A3M7RJA9_BRAPC|nr:hypothetical protein BpHYR1_050908 [Brachionus plicatilis]
MPIVEPHLRFFPFILSRVPPDFMPLDGSIDSITRSVEGSCFANNLRCWLAVCIGFILTDISLESWAKFSPDILIIVPAPIFGPHEGLMWKILGF